MSITSIAGGLLGAAGCMIAISARRRMERIMTTLAEAVGDVQSAEQALEARVAAHEAQDEATISALQDSIKQLRGGDTDTAIQQLEATVSRMQAFDPSQVATAPEDTGATDTTAAQ